jgi:hypothetical protein
MCEDVKRVQLDQNVVQGRVVMKTVITLLPRQEREYYDQLRTTLFDDVRYSARILLF